MLSGTVGALLLYHYYYCNYSDNYSLEHYRDASALENGEGPDKDIYYKNNRMSDDLNGTPQKDSIFSRFSLTAASVHAYSIAVDQIANRRHRDRPKEWQPQYDTAHARTHLSRGNEDDDQEYDLLVIGGGKTGCAVALDAATRGWRVCLVEAEDFGAGNGMSLPLMQLYGSGERRATLWQIIRNASSLKHEARERIHFFRVAPHLMREIPCLQATYGPLQRFSIRIRNFLAHTIVGRDNDLRSPISMNKFNMDVQVPQVKDMLHVGGGLVWTDAGFDEMRMITSMALTAAGLGATIVNHHRVEELLYGENGAVAGAKVRDLLNGDVHTVKSRATINATGAQADEIRQLDDPSCQPIISQLRQQQVLMTLRHHYGHYRFALFNRYNMGNDRGKTVSACMVPWERRMAKVATSTDLIDVTSSASNKPTEEQIQGLIDALRANFIHPVYRVDVLSCWLNTQYGVETSAMRRHFPTRDCHIDVSPSNLVTAVGAEWPTVRSAAEEIVDIIGKEILANSATHQQQHDRTPLVPSNTHSTMLYGSNNFYHKMYSLLHRGHGISTDTSIHLKLNYGDRSEEILRIMFNDPRLSRVLSRNLPVTEAEVVYVTRNECVRTAVDLIARRTGMLFINRAETLAVLDRVVELMAPILGWDEQRKQREIDEAREYIERKTA